jgi:2-polyprenyl-3-methyl-5-hydroxy-6-metoxy-1,4-benzoquinol methylase
MSDESPPATAPVWKTCLDVEGQEASHYLEYVNLHLMACVTEPPRHVLELGCSSGALGRELKKLHPAARYVGIEAGRSAAEVAATRLDQVICARLEHADLAAHGLQHGSFDLVIAGDILEHLVNPWDVLVRIRPFLAPDGIVLASIPNVRHLSVLVELAVHGEWNYVERGLLDVTHLRFFTLKGMRKLFEETGYRVEGQAPVIPKDMIALQRSAQGKPLVDIESGRLRIQGLTPADVNELCAFQYIIRARRA